jgi:carbonic anhydrase
MSTASLPIFGTPDNPVVTCMDARLHPSAALGITLGDAHIIRNAGGSAREALRSLVISQQLLGTEDVLVVKHTDCGMTTFTNEDLAEEAREAVGDFLTFRDLTKAVEDDVAFLKEGGLVKGEGVSGWIYDVKSGKVERVV